MQGRVKKVRWLLLAATGRRYLLQAHLEKKENGGNN